MYSGIWYIRVHYLSYGDIIYFNKNSMWKHFFVYVYSTCGTNGTLLLILLKDSKHAMKKNVIDKQKIKYTNLFE